MGEGTCHGVARWQVVTSFRTGQKVPKRVVHRSVAGEYVARVAIPDDADVPSVPQKQHVLQSANCMVPRER